VSDGQGHVVKARYNLPETEDGPKLITWTPQGSELWFKQKRRYLTYQTKRIAMCSPAFTIPSSSCSTK